MTVSIVRTSRGDFYDLILHLGKKIEPNFVPLNNAIIQTEAETPGINTENLNEFLFKNIVKIDFRKVREEAGKFLVDKSELKLLDKDILMKLISNQQSPE